MVPKKNPKADINRNSFIYFQVGLIIMLFISYTAINWQFEEKPIYETELVQFEPEKMIDVPITELTKVPPPPPPPPPAPEIIEVVEDNAEVVETTIESTETSQDEMIEIAEVTDIKEEGIVEEIEDVPFVLIANVPIFPGCETEEGNDARKKCMSQKIQEHVKDEFRTELSAELGLSGINRIMVAFRINEKGMVENIRARGPHEVLEAEAARVVKSLPKMTPGYQRNRPVGVFYSLPIIFEVRDRSL